MMALNVRPYREILQDEEERLQGGLGDLQEVLDQGDKDWRIHEARRGKTTLLSPPPKMMSGNRI